MVDELLIGQYVQNAEIAKRFSVYYDLFTKYRADYQIDHILAGETDADIVERARAAGFDERISLMGLITDALGGRVREAVLEERAVEFMHGRMVEMRNGIEGDEGQDASNVLTLLREEASSLQARLTTERKNGLLSDEKYVAYERMLTLVDRALRCDVAGGGVPFSRVKELFTQQVDALDTRITATADALDNAFRFVEDAFGEGQEMLLLVTDLSVNRYGMTFINNHGCERYFAHNEALLFHERGSDLADRINQLNLDDGE